MFRLGLIPVLLALTAVAPGRAGAQSLVVGVGSEPRTVDQYFQAEEPTNRTRRER
jgi:hypothetical protein